MHFSRPWGSTTDRFLVAVTCSRDPAPPNLGRRYFLSSMGALLAVKFVNYHSMVELALLAGLAGRSSWLASLVLHRALTRRHSLRLQRPSARALGTYALIGTLLAVSARRKPRLPVLAIRTGLVCCQWHFKTLWVLRCREGRAGT